MVDQLAVLDYREIALVLLHYANEHGGGQLQVVGFKGAQQRLRRLDQLGHLVEQRRFVGGLAADSRRCGDHCLHHQLAALAAIDDDALGRYGVKIGFGFGDRKGRKTAHRQPGRSVGKARPAAGASAGYIGPR